MELLEGGVKQEDDLITLSYGHYAELENDSLLLQCLRNAGVDNWIGYDLAIEEFSNMGEE